MELPHAIAHCETKERNTPMTVRDAVRRAPGLESTLSVFSQRVQSTYIVECRVSVLGIVVMIWESIPHNST